MSRIDQGTRAAGDAILKAGLVNDVVTVRDGRELTNRKDRRSAQAEHDYDDQRPARRDSDEDDTPRRKRRDDRQEDDERRSRRERDDRRSRREPAEDDEDREDFDDDEADEDSGDDHSPEADEDADDDSNPDGDDEHEGDDDGDEARESRNREDEVHEVTVDGERVKVSLRDLKAGYMKNRDYQHKTQALAGTRRALDAAHAKSAADLNEAYQRNHAIISKVRDLLIGQMDSGEMERLRREDPQAWTQTRLMMDDRIRNIDGVLNDLNKDYERHAGVLREHAQRHRSTSIQHEMGMLLQHVPDWQQGRDGRKPASALTAQYLVDSGFEPAEFQDVIDHRMLAIANKARLYDALMAKRKAENAPRKKARPVQKSASSEGRGGQMHRTQKGAQNARRGSEFRRAKENAKKSGSMRDGAKAIEFLIR